METVNDTRLRIERVGSPDEIARQALKTFIEDCDAAIAARGVFNVAISGGSTPERFFEMLGSSGEAENIPWDKIHIFWVDERCVPPEDESSNYWLAARTFLNKIEIPHENVHRMIGEVSEYSKAVEDYESTIRNVFNLAERQLPRFDLVVLGMGDDGHIGSLFPNSYAAIDTADLVSVVYFMGDKLNRITLTHPVLCASLHLMVLVSGENKAEIVRDVFLSDPDEVKYPVHTLWQILDRVSWVIDDSAAKYI